MNRMISKKVNRAPVRSPSPDIVNNNIIARTASPINEALTKSRVTKQFKPPMGKVFLDNQQLQNSVRSLQVRNTQLSKENSNLHEQNIRHMRQIDLLKEINFKSRKQLSKKNQPQFQPHSEQYGEYQTRISDLIQEIKRIQELLSKEIKKGELFARENQNLKYKIEQNAKISTYQQLKIKKKLTDIQDMLNQEFEKKLNQYQLKVQLVLNDEITKVNKIQTNQIILRNLFENKKCYPSPKYDEISHNQYSTGNRTPSVQSKKNEGITTQNFSHGGSQEVQCQNCKLYRIRISQLEEKLNVKEFILNQQSSQKQQETTIPPQLLQYLQRLQQIKQILNNQEVKSSINYIETNLNDIYSIDQKFQYMTSQKNKIIQELKEKDIQQSIQLIKMKKENALLRVQVHEQNEEIDRLKELINNEIAQFRSDSKSELMQYKKNSIGEADILRKYLQEATSKIEHLERQIQNSLKVQNK